MNNRIDACTPGQMVLKIEILFAIFIVVFFFLTFSSTATAATLILNTGAALKGKILEEKDDSVVFQNAENRQVLKIRLENIREVMLDPDEKKIADKSKKLKLLSEPETDIITNIQPTLGLMPGIAYPFGNIGKAVKFGYGAHLFTDFRIPMKFQNFQIRLGLAAGFIFHGTTRSDISANLMMFPITIYGKFMYAFDMGLRLYLKLGGGITPMMAKSMIDMDPTAAFGIGLGYVPPRAPFIEIFFEAGMMMLFEQVRGDFINANVGVAFRFGAPKVESKVETKPAGK